MSLTDNAKKRSFGGDDGESSTASARSVPFTSKPNSISSILNYTRSTNEESQLDPSLRTAPTATATQSAVSEAEKAERRERLRQEAERMRDALRQKERELADLD